MEKTVSERKTQNTHLPKRVAAYCRVAARGTDPSYGLDAQRAYYIQKINENPDWKMAGIYADEGLVGSAAKKRKEFNRMLAACKRGRIDIILTKSVSRFARNTVECLKAVRTLQTLGIAVIFEKENIDTSVENCDLMLSLMNQFALMESEHITQNIFFPVPKRPL